MLNVKGKYLYRDDQRYFYLADTCWSAFTNISLDDWKYYLDKRKEQGFNVIQINVLPQWDASGKNLGIYPFPVKHYSDGRYEYDYNSLNEKYFERAEKMLVEMIKRDLTPALVLLWANYVPGTWAGDMAPNNHFEYEYLESYVRYVVNRFKEYHPIYFVSGDTDFPTGKSCDYYRCVLRATKEIDPDALYSFHIRGRYTDIPEEFLKESDFFSYQSGHNLAGQDTSYTIPEKMRKAGFDGPIINTEPCYDQISYSRKLYGRFRPYDVRKASWSSVLAGADAGLTYGAHGIWSWHQKDASFGIVEGEGFDVPFEWRDAIKFSGAQDVAFLKTIITEYANEGLEPISIDLNGHCEIKTAKIKNGYLIYVPVNTQLDLSPLNINRNQCNVKIIDLKDKQIYVGDFSQKYINKLNLTPCLEDMVVVINTGGKEK